MVSDPRDALLYVVLADTAILGVIIVCFWVGIFLARRLGHPVGYGLGALGFVRPRIGYRTGVWLGSAVGLGALFLSFLLIPLSTLVFEKLGYSVRSNTQEPLLQGIQDWVGESPGTAILATISVVVLFGPAAEEIIFRGVLFGSLYKLGTALSSELWGHGKGAGKLGERISFAFAALVSSASFALLHLEPLFLATLFVLAIILCVLYQWTGSLFTSFVAHATFNSFAVLTIILTGLEVLPAQV
jgi:membrane protease YdiL (CAAX protease family)